MLETKRFQAIFTLWELITVSTIRRKAKCVVQPVVVVHTRPAHCHRGPHSTTTSIQSPTDEAPQPVNTRHTG